MPTKRQGVDPYYTPELVAHELATFLPSTLNGAVFDPAMGEGALLQAVEDRFGDSVHLLGLDLDRKVVDEARGRHAHWILGNANFLSPRSRGASAPWGMVKRSLSAVVMNPPFSYRGNGGVAIEYFEFRGRVTPAMHFLVEALSSLRPAEGFYTILPDGALDAERNRLLWEIISRSFSVDRLSRLESNSFGGARVSASLVQIKRHSIVMEGCLVGLRTRMDWLSRSADRSATGCRCIEIVRGRVPGHTLDGLPVGAGDVVPFIHTTDLQCSGRGRRKAPSRLADSAPLVVIARVGAWRAPRVFNVGRVVLSDCVYGLRPRAGTTVEDVLGSVSLLESAIRFEYRGTGAPYLTLESLARVLGEAGWNVRIVKAGSRVSPCDCSIERAELSSHEFPRLPAAGLVASGGG